MSETLPKGWVRLKELESGNIIRAYGTVPNGKGVTLYIKRGYIDEDYYIDFSGLYLYIKKYKSKSFAKVFEFAKKIMNYINYGRFKLKILDEKYFR